MLDTIKAHGFTITTEPDYEPDNPRTWQDQLGTMYCKHSRYTLGDEGTEHPEDVDGVAVILPLYLYDHGGITMNTTGFSSSWDSGQVGYIYTTRQRVLEFMGWKRLTKKRLEKLREGLEGEVKEYDAYLRNDAYKYTISDSEGDHIDSGYSFFDEAICREQALSSAKHFERDALPLLAHSNLI